MQPPSQLPPYDDAFQAHLRAVKEHKAANRVEVRNNGSGLVAARCPDDGLSSSASSMGFSFHDSFAGDTPVDSAAAGPGGGFGAATVAEDAGEDDAGSGAAGNPLVGHAKRGSSLGGALDAALGGGAAATTTSDWKEDSDGVRTKSSKPPLPPSSAMAFTLSAPATDPSMKPPDRSE